MNLLWLWLWMFLGMLTFVFKRAWKMVTGPNSAIPTYGAYFQHFAVPLGIRFLMNSVLFWLLFNPDLATKGLQYFGWDKASWVVMMITQFAPCAFAFGYIVDSAILDTITSKFPSFAPPEVNGNGGDH